MTLTWLLVAVPALSAAILLLGGRRTDAWGHLLGCAAPLLSFVFGVVLFVQMLGLEAEERHETVRLYELFSVGRITVDMSLLVDQLSIVFVLLITGVGGLIHIYSIGYMEHDPRRRRFFGYLNLFVAAMLLLVLAADYLVVFIGWEGVGLASYLLIGFWQYKRSAATAAKKAFVVNRVGDMGMSLAVMSMWALFGSSSFAAVDRGADELTSTWATLLGLMLLLAACGKSAQVPLQSWLLDAMEGPTPVSALIHAATMVTAGVYLVTRSSAIYEQTEAASTAVVVVGAVTLLVGAIIGCAKDDIKKVLAGSTMSQIGYMMLAAGLGPAGYALAIFHLLMHGFFKADMFLGAGSVMHGMNDDVNMRHYGALRKYMKVTFVTFAFGYLAILGIPPFSGFFSKDKIIEVAFAGQRGRRERGAARCRHHRVLHDPADDDDVLRREALGARRAPARVAVGDDLAADHPRRAVARRRCAVLRRQRVPRVPGAGRRPRGGAPAGQRAGDDPDHARGGGRRCRDRVRAASAPDIPREAPVQVSPVTTFARSDLYGDALNEAVSDASRASTSPARWSGSTTAEWTAW